MATYQKRGKTWRAIVRRQGKTVTRTFDTKAEAEAWALKTEAELMTGASVETAIEAVRSEGASVAYLFQRYSDEVSPKKKGDRWEAIRLKALARYPVFQRPAASVTGPDMAEWRDHRLTEVKSSTVNRELNLISAVFTHAIREWRLGLTVNPVHLISRPKNPKPRTQRVSEEDRKKIVAELGWDGESEPQTSKQWAAWVFCVGIETAMRKGEILKITWNYVHLEDRYVHLSNTKNDDARDVPLSTKAMRLFQMLTRRSADGRVVPIQSGNFDKIFRDARRAVGLMHVRMHDSRREATSTLSKKVSNVLELARITGHRDLKTLDIYFRPTPGELAAKLG